jgi:effector-binding domain-containing protein
LGTSKRFSELEKTKISELLAFKLTELRHQQVEELAEAKKRVVTLTKENQVKQALTDAMYSELIQFVKSKSNAVLLSNIR